MVRMASVGIRAVMLAAMIPTFGQTFTATADFWPTRTDESRKKVWLITYSPQGSEALISVAGGLPHKVQILHVTAMNLASTRQELVPLSLYTFAAVAGIREQGPSVTARILRSTANRSKPERAKRAIPALAAATNLGLALAKSRPEIQVATSVVPLAVALGIGAANASAPEPDVVANDLIREFAPVIVEPGGVYTGFIGALFDPKAGAMTISLVRYTDGELSLYSIAGAENR